MTSFGTFCLMWAVGFCCVTAGASVQAIRQPGAKGVVVLRQANWNLLGGSLAIIGIAVPWQLSPVQYGYALALLAATLPLGIMTIHLRLYAKGNESFVSRRLACGQLLWSFISLGAIIALVATV